MTTKERDRRLTKLESAFHLLISSLASTARAVLHDTDDRDMIALLDAPGATEANRLCGKLRKIQADVKQPPSRRLACGMLLAEIEVAHSVKPAKK